jgi:hypothetical protein
MTEGMSNQMAQQADELKQLANILKMQYLYCQTLIEMAKKHFSGGIKKLITRWDSLDQKNIIKFITTMK